MKICVFVLVRPTEDVDKVLEALKTVFKGKLEIEEEGEGHLKIKGCSDTRDSLLPLYHSIRSTQAISAVRAYLMAHTRRDTIILKIHKQAAYVGKISLVDNDRESPLGPITLTIKTSDPQGIIDWLAPELRKPHRSHRAARSHRKAGLGKIFD
jgi:predicted RNA binding protein with dsRBD fold (UPF0201 family)